MVLRCTEYCIVGTQIVSVCQPAARIYVGSAFHMLLASLAATQRYMNYQQYMGKYNRQDWMKVGLGMGGGSRFDFSHKFCA